jgi:hypothetical protein
MKLRNYFRSSASYRVRIVASLKGLSYEYVFVNLTRGESRTPAYEALNPQGRVPALEENGRTLTQSLAIYESPACHVATSLDFRLFGIGELIKKTETDRPTVVSGHAV